MQLEEIRQLEYAVLEEGGRCTHENIKLIREWDGNRCRSRLRNENSTPVQLTEVVLLAGTLPYPGETPVYGEGFSMLSQYNGTLDSIKCMTSLSDHGHYRIPQKSSWQTVYHVVLLSPQNREHVLMAFSSSHRFSGSFRFQGNRFEAVFDMEGLSVQPGEEWVLEEFVWLTGADKDLLFEELAGIMATNHPPLEVKETPAGWCSWYCHGPYVTKQDILDNVKAIKQRIPELRYIQIDDGYQPYMGDWLEPNPNFAGDIRDLCLTIRNEGLEPAIWVAPFIAEKDSRLFKEHPEWFVKDDNGEPLLSSEVSFGGWRNGPWYMLDGTHPGAQEFLRQLFRTIREEWHCRYFKLDANMWGAIHGGRHFDTGATRIEAYRRGMEAILEGAGADSFLLGCNAPMWASLGLVHGMRVTDDIDRRWVIVRRVAMQGLYRNWQHDRLWINDPDCIVLQNIRSPFTSPETKDNEVISKLTDEEFDFHLAYILASGGMILSGDSVLTLQEERMDKLKRCLEAGGISAKFGDTGFRIGTIRRKNDSLICLFNWEEQEVDLPLETIAIHSATDYFTGKSFPSGGESIRLSPHSAKVLQIP